MLTQIYRGHLIEVASVPGPSRFGYRSRVRERATGVLRHQDSDAGQGFDSASEATDQAFRQARAWVERFPLRWPFAVQRRHV